MKDKNKAHPGYITAMRQSELQSSSPSELRNAFFAQSANLLARAGLAVATVYPPALVVAAAGYAAEHHLNETAKPHTNIFGMGLIERDVRVSMSDRVSSQFSSTEADDFSQSAMLGFDRDRDEEFATIASPAEESSAPVMEKSDEKDTDTTPTPAQETAAEDSVAVTADSDEEETAAYKSFSL